MTNISIDQSERPPQLPPKNIRTWPHKVQSHDRSRDRSQRELRVQWEEPEVKLPPLKEPTYESISGLDPRTMEKLNFENKGLSPVSINLDHYRNYALFDDYNDRLKIKVKEITGNTFTTVKIHTVVLGVCSA